MSSSVTVARPDSLTRQGGGSSVSDRVAAPRDERRMAFLDGLRGVAAMAVVVFHLHENMLPAVKGWLPHWVSAVMVNGNLGVDVFFVLSGFVIAHSVSSGERSLGYLGRFGLRRSIRLDPPLWATIVMELVLIRISLMLFPSLGTPVPGWSQILANVTYTQRFLDIPSIVPVFWSLTYEVQFYIVLVVALIVLHKSGLASRITKPLFAAAFVYSLAIWLGAFAVPLRGLFIERWFQFALGIAAWAAVQHKIPKAAFTWLALATVAGVVTAWLVLAPTATTEYRLRSTETALIVAAVLAFVGLTNRMGTLLHGRSIQFLGRVSYSLYLVHLSIGWRFISLVRMKFAPTLGPVGAIMTFAGGIALSVFAAWVLYVILEAPSMKFARKIRLPSSAAPIAPAGSQLATS